MGKILLGLDVETSGLEPKADRIIEVGACTYDWDTKMPMQILSELIDPAMDTPEWQLPKEITEITGITDELVDLYGKSEKAAFAELHDLMSYADYAAAFNGFRFDQPFYIATCKRLGVEPSGLAWLDFSADIKFPAEITTRNLRHLASEHNFLNPLSHRSIFDVMTMFKIASQYSLDAIIARAAEPTLYVQAVVSFKDNQKAKDYSFRWHPDSKRWWKSFKQSDFLEVKDAFDFPIQMLDGPLEG